MKISIVTPSFNHAQFIERTIQSVLMQNGDFEVEHLVFDGGSTDGTLDILRRYEDRLWWVSEKDRGQSHAINKGLQRATGDIVCWLNSDDVLCAGALQRVVQAFADNPTIEWVHGRCNMIDEHDREIRRWISAYKHWRCRAYSYAGLVSENFISQMTVFWRRRVHERIGWLDESLRWAFDYDLWLRLGKLGDPLYLEQPQACFRWYTTSKSGGGFRGQFAEDFAVAERHAGARTDWLRRKKLKTRAIIGVYGAMENLKFKM
ncbi:MAG: glycosyltransferase [Anaerolineae bacterium]|nr:glycosyltransferase [Anaerolineae bacterium]